MKYRVAVMLLMPLWAQAGIYKCTVDGSTVYQASPCPDESKQITIRSNAYTSTDNAIIDKARKETENVTEMVKKTGDKCLFDQNLAKNIMEMRQEGAPIGEVMHIWDGMEKTSSSMLAAAYAKKLVEFAYEKPRYSTERYKQKAITDFSNKVYLECIKARR